MAGKYTEAQKKATKKYFDKLKEQGRPRNHGNKEKKDKYYVLILGLQKYLKNNNFKIIYSFL